MKKNFSHRNKPLVNWILAMREDDLSTIEEKQFSDVKISRDSYRNIFNQGLELIRRERLPKALMLEILDQYAARLEDLQGIDLSLENFDKYDTNTQEKIKALLLFGIQSELISENSKLIAELQLSNNNYEELIGIVTHEFKNMLTSIYGYNKILKRQLEKSGVYDTSELITTIEKLTQKLFNMIDSLLKMSLNDKGILEPQKKMIEIRNDVLAPIMKELKPLLIKKKMEIKPKVEPKEVYIMADKDFLQMVFRNLIENAIKYGRIGTEVKVEISVDRNKNRLIVKIKNQGIGIQKEIKNELFEKFKHTSVGEYKSGSGIGLYNAKNIIEKHGGKITFKSEPDQWTEFKFTLPIN